MAVLRGKLQGFVEQGGHSVLVGGLQSSTKVQQSYPDTTVTVYQAGTIALASIYSDAAGSLKANPFTADDNGYWFFYADEGRYDIRFSGGAITTPFTLSDVSLIGASGGIVTFNVRDYGALGDGVTNDRAAIVACIAACAASSLGGEVYFPPGNYLINSGIFVDAKSGISFRGAGMWLTSLTSSGNGIFLMTVTPGSAGNVTISDMAFVPASTNVLSGIYLPGDGVATGGVYGKTTIQRCRFGAANYSTGVYIDGAPNVTVKDCLFDGAGVPLMHGIYIDRGSRNHQILDNEFRYTMDGVLAFGSGSSTTQFAKDTLLIEGNRFDGGWWCGVEAFSGGASATYTSTTLTDLTQTFSGITAGVYVRAMPILRTGTATISALQITDAGATFVSSAVKPGYIIKTGTSFALVSRVVSETVLNVEEWLSNTDRSRVVTPASGSAYTLYKVIVGQVASNTGTAITVSSWLDFDGNATTPSAGTRYECPQKLQINPIQLGASTDSCRVIGNTLRRYQGDMIQTFGSYNTIMGNTLIDGRDMGISINGPGGNNTVVGNTIRHCGVNGIVLDTSNGNTVSDNQIEDANWIGGSSSATAGGIAVIKGSRNHVNNNNIKRVTSTGLNYGVVVRSVDAGNPANNNIVINNRSTASLLTTPFIARGANADNNKFLGNEGGTGFAQGWYDSSATNTRTNNLITTTWDPGSLADGASTNLSVFSVGALAGTPAFAALSSVTAVGWSISAMGISADTVGVTLTNRTGGTVDLASGTVTIALMQP